MEKENISFYHLRNEKYRNNKIRSKLLQEYNAMTTVEYKQENFKSLFYLGVC